VVYSDGAKIVCKGHGLIVAAGPIVVKGAQRVGSAAGVAEAP
jgi:hypothetical protein